MDDNWKKRQDKGVALSKRLVEGRWQPDTAGGKVVSLSNYTGEEATREQLEELGLDPEDLGYIDDHPEGSDRGGYVPFLVTPECSVFYDENAGEWWPK